MTVPGGDTTASSSSSPAKAALTAAVVVVAIIVPAAAVVAFDAGAPVFDAAPLLLALLPLPPLKLRLTPLISGPRVLLPLTSDVDDKSRESG